MKKRNKKREHIPKIYPVKTVDEVRRKAKWIGEYCEENKQNAQCPSGCPFYVGDCLFSVSQPNRWFAE